MALLISINGGSSSLKLTLFRIDAKLRLVRILDAHWAHKGIEIQTTQTKKQFTIHAHKIDQVLLFILKKIESEFKIDLSSLAGIGHRFIHGGKKYISSILITKRILKDLEKLNDLAPLHNPQCLALIEACLNYFGAKIPQVAVFDTAFHNTLPPHASEYAIPRNIALKYHVKRYGFHGISHAYLNARFSNYTQKKEQKLITLHLGNGCSAAASQNGISIDTSMGFSPAEGLIMGTRAGDLDFTLIEYLAKSTNLSAEEITHLLNFKSGLLGISSTASNIQTILNEYHNHPGCRLAIDMFCYRIIKYIGAYVAVLNGLDALIFSGGIGENSPLIRAMICSKLEWLNAKISQNKNKTVYNPLPGDVQKISLASSKIGVYVIGTDENIFIGEAAEKIIKKGANK